MNTNNTPRGLQQRIVHGIKTDSYRFVLYVPATAADAMANRTETPDGLVAKPVSSWTDYNDAMTAGVEWDSANA